MAANPVGFNRLTNIPWSKPRNGIDPTPPATLRPKPALGCRWMWTSTCSCWQPTTGCLCNDDGECKSRLCNGISGGLNPPNGEANRFTAPSN